MDVRANLQQSFYAQFGQSEFVIPWFTSTHREVPLMKLPGVTPQSIVMPYQTIH